MEYPYLLNAIKDSMEQISLTLQDIYIEIKKQTKLIEKRNEFDKNKYMTFSNNPTVNSKDIVKPFSTYRNYFNINITKKEINNMDINTLISNLYDELDNRYKVGNEFIDEQSSLIKKYTSQLTQGQITQEQYQGLIEDIQKLSKLEELQQEVEKKAIYQGFENMIQDIILDGISAVFKSKTT